MIAVPIIEVAWVPMVSYIVVSGWPAAIETYEGVSAMVIGVDAVVPGAVAPLVRYIETVPWPDQSVA